MLSRLRHRTPDYTLWGPIGQASQPAHGCRSTPRRRDTRAARRGFRGDAAGPFAKGGGRVHDNGPAAVLKETAGAALARVEGVGGAGPEAAHQAGEEEVGVRPLLPVYDHGALRGATASKGITCEGLPTGKTRLIQRGKLVGLLANFYEQQRILKDPQAAAKLGKDPRAAGKALVPRNGFRFGEGGGRRFEGPPGISPTNILVESRQPVSQDDLLARVGEGLYVGRIWYTYPINGLRAGDFTCTVVGDSFLIQNGRLASPIRANAIRINDNIQRVLRAILGITADRRETTVWAADEVIHAPEIAVEGVRVDAIADPRGLTAANIPAR